jgi:hypothetical protein
LNPSFILRRAAVVGFAVLLISGCTDRKQLKEEWLQAAAKQEQIQSYQFAGQADFQLDPSLFQGAQPLTAAMLSAFKEGRLTYQGKTSLKEPLQAEADFKLTPKGSEQGWELPVLLKDNKLYAHLPIVSKADEYLAIPLTGQSERLNQTGRLSAAGSAKLLQGLDPAWLEPGGKDEKLAGGEAATRITLNVTDKNRKAVSDYLVQAIPAALGEWTTSGLLSDVQTQALKQALGSLQLAAPSSLDIWIDAQGFIRQQKAELRFSLQEGGPVHSVTWTHTTDAVNEPPAFVKDTPKQVKPLADLLKLLPKLSGK